jgi:ribosomal protein L11 methyltransferase
MWVSVALETDAAHADSLSDALLAAGAISVGVEDAQAGTDEETPQFGEPGGADDQPIVPLWSISRVVALFDPSPDLIGRIAAATVAAGIDDLPEIELDEVAEQDWVRLTQSQFDPIRVNDRLWIVPSWHAAPDAGAINLVLDPGLAFGTGSHPTTFLCLQWLTETLRSGDSRARLRLRLRHPRHRRGQAGRGIGAGRRYRRQCPDGGARQCRQQQRDA